jgi:hypothetical protein
MKKGLLILIITGMVVCGFAFGAVAEQGKINQAEEKGKVSPEAQAVADLTIAGQLAEYGRRTNNPMAMIAAAQIMKNTPVQDKKQEKTAEGTGEETGKKSGVLETADKLLADAQALAKQQGNDAVASLAEKESKITAQRDAVGGPVRHVDRVRAGYTDSYTVTFKGGEEAIVAVIGDGDCDLDLYVYDENGNLVGKDTDGTDRCLVRWTPRWTGKFHIKIENICIVYADYILATN